MGLTPKQRHRFARYEDWLAAHQPDLTLHVDSRAETAVIAGPVMVDLGAGVRHNYDLEVDFLDADPFVMPDVWDRVGHFPAEADRHIVEVVGRGRWWCLGLRHAPPVDFAAAAPLEPFYAEVRGFVVKQHIFDDHRRAGDPHPWPGAAWSHGLEGYVEWVAEQIGPADNTSRRALVPFLLGAPLAIKRTCPCGSGRKAGECHRRRVLRVSGAAKQDWRVREAALVYGVDEKLR